jgi:uroporphyrinogen III methyltransferase/synthase
MADTKATPLTRRSPEERVHETIRADFPDLRIGDGFEVVPATAITGTPPAGREEMVFPEDTAAAGLGVRFREGDRPWLALRRFYTPPVVFAGAGPGGLGMLTMGAVNALKKADIVLADALCGTEVLRPVPEGAEIVDVGKRCGKKASAKQEEINRQILVGARRGRRVVRLKGGDPSVFGRLEEEIDTVKEQELHWRVLPGIGAASGAAAFLGQPLTVRQVASEVIFSTGRLAGGGKNPFPLNGPSAPAIALYMSRRVLAERMADLESAGYGVETPVAVVEKVGSPETRAVVGTVGTIAERADEAGIGTPAVVLVGAQFETPRHLPLAGQRVWLPGETETALAQRDALEELGATCILKPLIEPEAYPVDEGAVFSRSFDWVVFTSKKGVDYLFDILAKWGLDSRWLPKVAAIGRATIQKLRARGIKPDLIPSEHTRVALSESLIAGGLAGKRVLIPASVVAPDHLREALSPHADEVVRLDLYGLRYPEVDEVPSAEIVLFSSETTVKSAKQNGLLGAIAKRGMIVGGIGPATCGRLTEEGLPPAIVPDGVHPECLARATRRFFANLEMREVGEQ